MGARGDHLQRLLDADDARQPLGAASARQQAEIDLGQAAFGRTRGDTIVADQRDFQPAAERGAVNGRDHRLGRILDRGLHLGQRRPSRRLAELGDVGAGDERLAGAGQHDGLDRVVGDGLLDPRQDAGTDIGRQRVDRRRVDRQHGDAGVHGKVGDRIDGRHRCVSIGIGLKSELDSGPASGLGSDWARDKSHAAHGQLSPHDR